MSNRYTHGHSEPVLEAHARRGLADSAAYLMPVLREGMSVLDVGCGPGSITIELAQAVAPVGLCSVGAVVGVDRSAEALARARAAAADVGARVEFREADVMALPFEDGSFDVVHAHQVLQHLSDPVGALREMSRVCRPGGWIAVRDADYRGFQWHPYPDGLRTWLATYRAVARANGAEPDAGRHMRQWAREAGLREARVSTSVWGYSDDVAVAAHSATWAARCRDAAFAAQAAEQGQDAAAVEDMARGWEQWGADPDAWHMIPHVEVLARPGRA